MFVLKKQPNLSNCILFLLSLRTVIYFLGPLNNKSNQAMKRWKPPQQIYRPGSGPLRKSGQADEQEPVDTNQHFISNKQPDKGRQNDTARLKRNEELHSSRQSCNSESDTFVDTQKRQKKPEQQLYVPKPMAQAMADREVFSRKNHQNKSDNWNANKNERPKTSRCFTRNEYHAHHNGNAERGSGKNRDYDNRDVRQGSEPRNVRPHTVHSERFRDTRSVEPAGNIHRSNQNEKLQSKPPSGRRHSTVGVRKSYIFTCL